jgi:hypothetical protein
MRRYRSSSGTASGVGRWNQLIWYLDVTSGELRIWSWSDPNMVLYWTTRAGLLSLGLWVVVYGHG